MNRLATVALVLIAIAGCSKGGSNDNAGLPVVPQPEAAIVCTSYHNPGFGAISIAPQWQERLDECRALALCEVDGECRYGCPRSMVTGC